MGWVYQTNLKGPQGNQGPQGEKGDPGDSGDIHALNDVTITNYTESVIELGPVGDSCTLSLNNGTVIKATLTSSLTTTFTMPTPVPGKSFILFVRQPVSTGGQGAAVFTNVHWPWGYIPTITIYPGKMDIFTFFSDGVNWYGSFSQSYDVGEQDVSAGAKFVLPNQTSVNYPVLQPIRRAMKARSTGRR